MSNIKTLTQRRAEIAQKLEAIEAAATAADGWTDDQRAQYDTLLAEQEQVAGDVDRLTRRREAELAGVRRDRGGVETAGRWAGDVPEDEQIANIPAAQAPIVYRGCEALDEPDRIRAAFGQQLIDIHAAMTGLGMSAHLQTLHAAAQGAGERVGSEGGFMVQTDIGGLLQREVMTGSALLSRVRPVTLGPNSNGITFKAVDEKSRATGSRWGGVQGYWVGEGTTAPTTKPKFREVELKLRKVMALGYATDELLQDAVAMGNVMFEAFADELRFLVEHAIFNGSGVGQPLGILNAPCLVTQAKETGQTADTIASKNLSHMWARAHARGKGNSVWLINTDCSPELDNLYVSGTNSDLEARYVTYGPDGVTRVKGRPVVETEYNATLGDAGDIVLANLGQYLFASKAMQMASSMHVAFMTDEMAFRLTWRVDGRPAWITTLTPFKGSNTLSPFVALAARA